MMLDSTVVCRRALGCEWGGGINKDHGGLGTSTGRRRRSFNKNQGICPCLLNKWLEVSRAQRSLFIQKNARRQEAA